MSVLPAAPAIEMNFRAVVQFCLVRKTTKARIPADKRLIAAAFQPTLQINLLWSFSSEERHWIRILIKVRNRNRA